MPQDNLTANQVQVPNVSDSCINEGAQILQLSAMLFDGTGSITYIFNTDNIPNRKISSVRAIYFDARGLSADAVLSINNGPSFRLPLGKQGYIPLFTSAPLTLSSTSATGNGTLTVYLFNFKVYPIIW
jgi:hypothetical protein